MGGCTNMKPYFSMTYKSAIEKIANLNHIKKSSVLVTGATGLIGSCVVDVLLESECVVYALDLSKDKLISRFGGETDNLRFVVQDVCEPLDDDYLFDYIIHTASFADPKSYALYPVETILINVLGAKNVLDYAKKHVKTKVLITSTFETYGKLNQDTYEENEFGLLDFNSLRSCYPESKRTAEVLLKSYKDEYGVNGVIVRLSSVFGPTMSKNDSKAHAQFLFNALNNQDIVLKSKGLQKRTYTYVMDAVWALLFVLSDGISGEAYNIANGNSVISIFDLANTIAGICGVRVKYDVPDELETKGYSKPQNCILDTNKICKMGWTPLYSLDDGLKQTLKIMKEMKDAGDY